MWFGMNLPNHRAISNIQSVHNSISVAEQRGFSAIADGNSGFHGGGRLKHPPQASACSVQRVDGAIFAAYKQSSGIGSGLTESGHGSGKSECPFQLEIF